MGQIDGISHAVGAPQEGFGAYDVPLGDLMRGERATMGKSLLDVERDLKIRATYIAAIENADLSAFSTHGFVAGYVRSYARYLGMDADDTFQRFRQESGFAGVHGTSVRPTKRPAAEIPRRMDPNDVISSARVSLVPERDSLLSRIEPGALGSALVLLLLVGGIGFGGWSVLKDIQRVQFAPVAEAPQTFAELDPLAAAQANRTGTPVAEGFGTQLSQGDDLDRLYRPQALDVPVLVPRDEPIASLDPNAVGRFSTPVQRLADTAPVVAAAPETATTTATATVAAGSASDAPAVQVTERSTADEVILFAVRPSWIRVTAASGTVLFEGTLNSGDSYALPQTETAPTLRAGNSGSLYFAVNGVTLGPAGPGTSIARDVELSADALSDGYVMADARSDPDLPRVASLVLEADPAAGQ